VRATVWVLKRLLGNRLFLFAAVGVIAGGIAAALITVSLVGSKSKKAEPVTTAPVAVATGPTEPTTVPGAAATQKLFAGIPQKLNVLGRANAPVTLIEFADPQCPFCREFTLKALPALLREYVRPGKVKLVLFGIAFIGPESETALRATYAAGLQNRLWNFLDLLYKNQGDENSGWVTDGLLRSVGASIPGFDPTAMMTARTGSEVSGALQSSAQQAQNAGVSQTPTFFAGRAGATLQPLNIKSLTADAFRPKLDALLK
jgi:protein-disulfide isomerase